MYLLRPAYGNDVIAINDHGAMRLGSASGSIDHSYVLDHKRLGPAANTEKSKQEYQGQAEMQITSAHRPFRCDMRSQNSSHFNLSWTVRINSTHFITTNLDPSCSSRGGASNGWSTHDLLLTPELSSVGEKSLWRSLGKLRA
jgi:hypothetical protein